MLQRLAVLAIVVLGGCDLYWNNNADDVCDYGYDSPGRQDVRNPVTGQCQTIGHGGGGCGGQPLGTGAAQPNWASCTGPCEALTEGSCLATAACHAAYLDNPTPNGGHTFFGCWELPPSVGPSGTCATLDAQDCSDRDDCITNYISGTHDQQFLNCAAEPQALCTTDSQCGSDARCDTTVCHSRPCPTCPTCGDGGGQCAPDDTCYGVCVPRDPKSCATVDCGPGAHCQEQCYPCDSNGPEGCMSQCQPMCLPDTTCADVDCGPGYTCEETCTAPGGGQPGTCAPQCVANQNDPGSCTGTVSCTTPPPACPVGSTAGIANGCYTGYCIPNADCGPHDPGMCTGPVTCITGEPACPAGTVAGIKNGCWTGYCIPQSACPAPSCESLGTEASCTARPDCIAVYDGVNCTCTGGQCVCESETYARCETVLLPL